MEKVKNVIQTFAENIVTFGLRRSEDKIEFRETEIEDLWVIQQSTFFDARGSFIKTFQQSLFDGINFRKPFRESYFTESFKGVIRGMHFQTPPADHVKHATVISGRIIDIVIDIRKNSSTFGKIFSVELSRENAKSILIPAGCAHGFCALTDQAIVYYNVTSEYSRQNDMGIHPLSFGFEWPIESPILSERDLAFPSFADFDSPF